MDFDDVDEPKKVTTRVSRFAPKSSKPKLKKEPELVPKSEPASLTSTKIEPQEVDLTGKQNKDEVEINGKVKIDAEFKPEGKDDSTKVDSMDVEMTEAEDDSMQVRPMDEDDEEDTVVREIDIVFSPSIDDDTKLYVLQYPLRASWRPYELDERCEEVRLNPTTSEVEVDLSIDSVSDYNFDREFADKIKYTKQTLSTVWKPPTANGCAVGILMGDKLHLHPIHAVVQLRPSRDYLDKKKVTGANAKSEGSIEDKSVATSKKQNKQMKPSIGLKSDEDEVVVQPWVPLKYHGCKSDISARYFQQMVAQESSPINFEMSTYDYISTLCPGVSNNTLANASSKRYLLSLPVEKRLEKLLIEGPPLRRFSAIKHFALEYSDDELLSFLKQHALLVQGFWVPKSRLLYPKGGIESMARNYVLVLFNNSLKVTNADLKFKADLVIRIKHFVMQFALEKYDIKDKVTYWKFKELPDESFIKEFPNVVKQQEEIFKTLEQEVSAVVGNVGKQKSSKSAVTTSGVNSDLVRLTNSDTQVASSGEVPPSNTAISSETRHALSIALKKLFDTHKVCSFTLILQELRALAVNKSYHSKGGSKGAVDAAHSIDDSEEKALKVVLGEVACNIHGCYVLKSSQDDPLSSFRDVVIDMLRGSGPNGKLKKAEILEAARRKLGRDVPNSDYTKVMAGLCVSKGSFWVLKSGDGSKK